MHDSATEGREKPDNVTTAVHSWNEHKRKTFTKQRIESAWQRLRAEGGFNSSPKFVLICATALGILHLLHFWHIVESITSLFTTSPELS